MPLSESVLNDTKGSRFLETAKQSLQARIVRSSTPERGSHPLLIRVIQPNNTELIGLKDVHFTSKDVESNIILLLNREHYVDLEPEDVNLKYDSSWGAARILDFVVDDDMEGGFCNPRCVGWVNMPYQSTMPEYKGELQHKEDRLSDK